MLFTFDSSWANSSTEVVEKDCEEKVGYEEKRQ